ncbi:transporter [Kitasatospora herbaricolor]|uniref:purine-cytosine permease family protein n=1 Tax=Kitasatospora herbaricolor TaxID=68217 RepID=UPI0019B55480|nr:cytosine permease [Kitasatospora herbaricolor]MDQ0307239.1 purine-cytosine permease-like protein [Kitasatospora herbaricolor]GGV31423.1 transporter [Kitasatospora herbaricolor]
MPHSPAPAAPSMIEQHGVDTIPEAERTSSPRDVLSILVGSNLAFGVVVFGWLPVSFGLSFWASVSSVVLGTVLGIALTAPLALVSLRTATNLSTSSGAHFGVRGRLIGSVVGLLLSLGYTALSLWVGGDVVVGALNRLLGLPSGGPAYVATYTVLAALSATAAVFGYRLMLKLERWLMWAMSALLLAGLVAFAPHFDPSGHGSYLLGGFRPTWLLSVVAAGLSGPIAFITLLGDYTRYVSPARHGERKVLGATALGLLVGLLIPQLLGTFTAIATGAGEDYVGGLIAGAPVWFLVPLLLNGLLGSAGNTGLMLYSMGLDLDAILPRATRRQATHVVAAVAVTLVFLGHFVWNAQSAVTSFVLVLTAIGAPWAVITLIGYRRCRGDYDRASLQVLNRRTRGGVYWYRAGWNVPATVAWAAGSAVGLCAVDTPVYRGPLLPLTGGIDLSFVLSGAVAAVLYVLLSRSSRGRAGTAVPVAVPVALPVPAVDPVADRA